MAVTGTLELDGTISGLPEGESRIQLAWAISTTGAFPSYVGLQSGDNTFTIPTGCTVALLIPPAVNAVVVRLGGATGPKIQPAKPTLHAVADTSLVINAASAVAGFRLMLY